MINGYDIAYTLAGLTAAPFWLLHGPARRKVRRALTTRLGQVPVRHSTAPAVMIHAVSLGEINATRSLVQTLRSIRPDLHIILSTTTETGYQRGQQLYANIPNLILIRFPLDFSLAVARVLDRLRPTIVVLMELEVWPNFLRQCRRREIPVMVINARLTPHSLKRYRWISPITRRMFSRLAAVGAQERGYADQFVSLGVPPDRVTVTGTMKFDTAEVGNTVPGAEELAASLGFTAGEPLWVCGSTGPAEEQLILTAYTALQKEFPSLRLAIIPRHSDRFDEVASLIQSNGFPLLRRSVLHPSPGRPVLLGDTMGELRKFYALATVVLVGRTLVDLGSRQRGSDMIEPAALAKPTLVGPWTQNFAEVMNTFRADHAIHEIHDGAEIQEAVAGILRNPALSQQSARRAQQTVLRLQGATQRHAEMILQRLPPA